MELRSARQKRLGCEFKELKFTLTNMGLFEKGMKLEEMRQILAVVQESANETSRFLESDMEQAMKESELDFAPTQDDLLHSTMIQTHTRPDLLATSASTSKSIDCSSPFSSPEIPSKKSTIRVEVHHPMNWSPDHSTSSLHVVSFNSPDGNRSQRKRYSSGKDTREDSIELDAKRAHTSMSLSSPLQSQMHTSPTALSKLSSYDSGINMSISSDADASTRVVMSQSEYGVADDVNDIIENVN